MIIEKQNYEATPSVHFNFDNSNQKQNQIVMDSQYIPYDYSFSNIKMDESYPKQNIKINQHQRQFVTPSQYDKNIIYTNLLQTPVNNRQNISYNNQGYLNNNKENLQSEHVKLNTQQFFDQFDNNFVINFGDSPQKNQSRTQFINTFESCPAANLKQTNTFKADSYISEPLVRRLSIKSNQNQQDIQHITISIKKDNTNEESIKVDFQKEKQNMPPENLKKKSSKVNCQIRKRVILKNNQKLINKLNSNKMNNENKSNLIKRENLLIITSSNWQRWTDFPKDRKVVPVNSQPLKKHQKSVKKTESNIFSSRQKFKQTLRSTTLDNWKKKFIFQKNQHKIKAHNIFQKPFSLLR